MKYFVLAAGILLAALVGLATPAFAEEGKVIDGSETKAISSGLEEQSEPEEKSGPKSAGLKFPGFGIWINLGITSALMTTEGSVLVADGGGLEIGGMVGYYPLLFGEMGVEVMRFDLTTESDKEVNQRVRVEMYGYYAGGGVGLPLGDGGIGFRYRIQRKSLVALQIENRDTGETDIFRDRVTRRSYFIFLAFGGPDGKSKKKGDWLEVGFRYDDVDKNIFLISDVLGIYARAMLVY